MIPLSAEEDMDVREIIVPAMSYGRHTITFTRDVEVQTKRYMPHTFDGVIWSGTLTFQEGERIPVREIKRGYKQRPCRLNELSIPTTEFALDLLEVPEDSYEDDAKDEEGKD